MRLGKTFRCLFDKTDYCIANGRVFDSKERPNQAGTLLRRRCGRIGFFGFGEVGPSKNLPDPRLPL